jgi:predicted histone-like DNA-binding protein
VKLVLDGLLFVVKQKLQDGQTIQLGDLGYFQAVLGSKGSPTKKEFTTDLVRRPRVVFRPGKTLLELAKKLKVERMVLDKNEPDSGSGSGGGDRPEIE